MKLKPASDQRYHGICKEAIDQDQDKQALVFILVKKNYGKRELMEELFPKDGVTITPISERSKEIIKHQGNVEMFKICELSNKV